MRCNRTIRCVVVVGILLACVALAAASSLDELTPAGGKGKQGGKGKNKKGGGRKADREARRGGIPNVLRGKDGINLVIGEDLLHQQCRIVFSAFPIRPFSINNYRDGTLGWTYLDHNVLTFGFLKDQVTPIDQNNKNAAGFREVRDDVREVVPAPVYTHGQSHASAAASVQHAADEPDDIEFVFLELDEEDAVDDEEEDDNDDDNEDKDKPEKRKGKKTGTRDRLARIKRSSTSRVGRRSGRRDSYRGKNERHNVPRIRMPRADIKSGNGTFLYADNMTVKGALHVADASPAIASLRQWSMLYNDDFDQESTLKGWSSKDVNVCGASGDVFLGGYCHFSDAVVSKTYPLPKHGYLRVQARVHFLDKWRGEFMFLKVDGKPVWTKSHRYCPQVFESFCRGINVCGNPSDADTLSTHIDVTLAHTGENVEVSFSSSLERDACEVSWGIDDVRLSVLG